MALAIFFFVWAAISFKGTLDITSSFLLQNKTAVAAAYAVASSVTITLLVLGGLAYLH